MTTTVLSLLRAEGYELQADGMVAKQDEEPHPLFWFGMPPKPEDYVLKKSGLSLEDLYRDSGYRPVPASGRGEGPAGPSDITPTTDTESDETDGLVLRRSAGETLQ